MAKDAEKKAQQPKPKKKWGFLGTLLRLFLFFVLLCAIGTGVVYWKRKPISAWGLQIYAYKLIDVMIANYQIAEDEECRAEVKGKEGDIKETSDEIKARWLDKRKTLACKMVTEQLETYKTSSAKEWYTSFKELNEKSKEILQDQRVTPQELQDFLQRVEKVTETYKQATPPVSSENDKQEPPK